MASSQDGRVRRTWYSAWHLQLVLVLIGCVISGYLTYTELTTADVVCVDNDVFDCETVQHSKWSKFMGIPVAYFGLATYLGIGTILVFEHRSAFLIEHGQLVLFAIGIVAWVYSMFLVYVQLGLLEAICIWCLSHEITITILFGVICYRLWGDMKAVPEA